MEGVSCFTSHTLKKCLVIFGCILVQLTLGSRYSLSNFSPYIISYLRARTADTTITNVDILWMAPAGVIGPTVGMTLGGALDKRFGPRVTVTIGAVVFVSSVLLSDLAVKHSFIAFVLSYGGYGTFGLMMCYGVTIQTAIKWLHDRPAFASGLVMMGLGASAFIFNQVITQYINPDNILPNKTETGETERYFLDDGLLDRVPSCFLLLGGIYAGMMFIGILCLFDAPPIGQESEEKEDPKTLTDEERDFARSSQSRSSEEQKNDENLDPSNAKENAPLSTKEAIKLAFKTRSFYILWLTFFSVDYGIQFTIGMNKVGIITSHLIHHGPFCRIIPWMTIYQSSLVRSWCSVREITTYGQRLITVHLWRRSRMAYGQTFIEDDHFLALVGSVGSIFNCIMRPLWGLLLDRFGFKVTVRCLTFGLSLTVGTIMLTEHMHKAFYMVWTAVMYAIFCGLTPIGPSTLSKLFGAQNMAVNYGFVMSAGGCAAIISSVTATTLKEILGWHNMFFMSAAIIIVPFFTTFFFNGKDRDGQRV